MVASGEKIVYYLNLACVLLVDFGCLLGFEEKFPCMIEVVAVFVCDIHGYMVQKNLVVNNLHQMINNPYDEVFAFYFYFFGKMGSFRYDPVDDVN